ncbi:MAG: hypothetical protein BWY29_00695 [Microgenomates group bacterium ADurb.Bin238]|nr:MAG: hypothetical protein BWY29_00695 [Microgenomates group bacterium ADurb.Bin238]
MLYQTKKRQRPWFKETLPKGQRALEKECGQEATRTGEETTDDHDDDQHAPHFVCFFHLVYLHCFVLLSVLALFATDLVLTNQ